MCIMRYISNIGLYDIYLFDTLYLQTTNIIPCYIISQRNHIYQLKQRRFPYRYGNFDNLMTQKVKTNKFVNSYACVVVCIYVRCILTVYVSVQEKP